MTRLAHVIVAVLIFGCGESRVYDRCELALELRYRHEIVSDAEVANWVCIAQFQSAFNTAAVGHAGGTGYHGLLQISDEFWCSTFGEGKACGMSCSRLVDDDITDDLHCSRIIHEEHQRLSGDGFNAWAAYKTHCNDGKALPYIHGCFDNYISREDFRTSLPTVSRPSYTPSEVFRSRSRKTHGKVYERCELAQELVYKHHIPIEEVAMWVCIAKHESAFNTSAVGHLNADGSGDHGLFQISDIYWCSPPGKGWVCGLSCAQLEDDDISDDVKCMRKIYAEHQRLSGDGFNAWTVYGLHCRGRAEKYIDGCFTEDDQNNVINRVPGIVAPVHPPSFTPSIPSVRKLGKIYSRCELAQELMYTHLLPREQIATWVCIAEHESSLNTAAVGRLNADGSADHGLFQISDLYWCSPPGNGLGCGINCDLLEDEDISDDVECIRRIHKEHTRISGNGFTAWTVYNRNCLWDVDRYIKGCFPEEVPTTEKPTTSKVFSFSFGQSLSATEVPKDETTTPKRFQFTFGGRQTEAPEVVTSQSPVPPTRVFSYRFGEKVATTEAPKDVILSQKPETTTPRRFQYTFANRESTKTPEVIQSEPPATSRTFSYRFGEKVATAEVPKEVFTTKDETTTSRTFTFGSSTTESPRKVLTTKKKAQTFNIFDFYLNYFKTTQKTTKKPSIFKTTTLEIPETPTEITTERTIETTTRKPSVFDIYLRRTTPPAKVFAPKSTTFFANSLPTVKPFDLDYIKGLTTPKNIISRAAQDPPTTSRQRAHFDSIFDTFFHG